MGHTVAFTIIGDPLMVNMRNLFIQVYNQRTSTYYTFQNYAWNTAPHIQNNDIVYVAYAAHNEGGAGQATVTLKASGSVLKTKTYSVNSGSGEDSYLGDEYNGTMPPSGNLYLEVSATP